MNTEIDNNILETEIIKTKGDKFKIFYWQNGYGSFSVNPREVDKVVDYIKNQKEHHRTKSFQEEFLLFLKNYEIEFYLILPKHGNLKMINNTNRDVTIKILLFLDFFIYIN